MGFYRLWSEEYSPSNWNTPLVLGVVGLFFGILLPYILKVKIVWKIIKINFSTGVLSILFYVLITLLINWNYFVSDRQHYSGSGLMGYIDDLIFLTLAFFIIFGIALIIGFLIGGISLYIYQNKILKA